MKTTTTSLLLGIALGLCSQASTNLWAQADSKSATPDLENKNPELAKSATGIEPGGRELTDEELKAIRGEQFEFNLVKRWIKGEIPFADTWRYGNWGGKNWSGGVYALDLKDKKSKKLKDPCDELDQLFQKHDTAYDKAYALKNAKDQKAGIDKADADLVMNLLKLKFDAKKKTYGPNKDKDVQFALTGRADALAWFGLQVFEDKSAQVLKTTSGKVIQTIKLAGSKLTPTSATTRPLPNKK